MNFKVFARTRPLYVGIGLGSNTPSVDYTVTGWQPPFQGVWAVGSIGGGGGSGAYNNSRAYSSEAGYNAFSSTTVHFLTALGSSPVIGAGGGGGTIVGITFNAGSSGGSTVSVSTYGGGSGGVASTGSPLTSSRSSFPFSSIYPLTSESYFLGTSAGYLSPNLESGGAGRGADGVYGSLSTNLVGSKGNAGYIQFTCIG